jgi:hypothetical protein
MIRFAAHTRFPWTIRLIIIPWPFHSSLRNSARDAIRNPNLLGNPLLERSDESWKTANRAGSEPTHA